MATVEAPRTVVADVRARVAALEPRRVATVTIGVTGLLGVMGALRIAADVPRVFDLDDEFTLGSLWSAALLLAAGFGAVLVWTSWSPRREVWPCLVFAVLFPFMAFDELLGIHEALEVATGVDWQLLYVPLILVAGLAAATWCLTLLRHPSLRSALLWFACGCAAWLLAEVLEALEWDGERAVEGFGLLMVPEEILEAAGTCGFLLAMLLVVRRCERRRS